eukprot:1152662-Pelagomonas_calceolata.AAC.2
MLLMVQALLFVIQCRYWMFPGNKLVANFAIVEPNPMCKVRNCVFFLQAVSLQYQCHKPSQSHASRLCITFNLLLYFGTDTFHYAPPMQEITDLRQTLNGEVEALRADFMDLRTSLKQQLGRWCFYRMLGWFWSTPTRLVLGFAFWVLVSDASSPREL